MSPQVNSQNSFEIALAFYLGFTRKRLKLHFLFSNVSVTLARETGFPRARGWSDLPYIYSLQIPS